MPLWLRSDFASRARHLQMCLDRLVVTLADVTSRVCRFEILNLLRVQLKSDVARSCGKQTFFFSLCLLLLFFFIKIYHVVIQHDFVMTSL